jgi:Ras-related protein Rab-2A
VTIGVEFGSRIVPVGPPALPSTNVSQATNSSGVTTSISKTPIPKAAEKAEQKHMKLSLWDTAGQETYKSVTRSYFRGASGALLVFDITRRDTFAHVTDWLADLRGIAEEGIVIVLVGNKSDLAPSSTVEDRTSTSSRKSNDNGGKNQRAVTREEAMEWCRQNDILQYVETSAKSGEGVEKAFLEVANRIWQNIEAGRYDLNDRRSGVKAAAAAAGGRGGSVTLGGGNKAAKGGCC